MKMKSTVLLSLATLTLAVSVTGCQSKATEENTATTAVEQSTEATSEAQIQEETMNLEELKVKALPQLDGVQVGDTIATFNTNKGVIKVRLFPEYAPKAVENFTTHAKEGYYDGVTFHRVIENFMIQGGDPEGNGTGGESIWGDSFENEVSYDLRNFRGALSMANAGGTNTNGSQFFIVQNPDVDNMGAGTKDQFEQIKGMKDEVYYDGGENGKILYGDIFPEAVIDEYVNNGGTPTLDMGYTVFGQVYEGMDVVDSIAAVDTDESDKPLEDVIIESIEIGTYEG